MNFDFLIVNYQRQKVQLFVNRIMMVDLPEFFSSGDPETLCILLQNVEQRKK